MTDNEGFFLGFTIALGIEAMVACFIMAAIAFNAGHIAAVVGGWL